MGKEAGLPVTLFPVFFFDLSLRILPRVRPIGLTSYLYPTFRYAKKGIFPLGGIKCYILATLNVGYKIAAIQTD